MTTRVQQNSMTTNKNKKNGDGSLSNKNLIKILNKKLGETGLAIDNASLFGKRGICHNCQEDSQEQEQLLKCGACKKVFYCSKECQKTHWKQGGHREECAKVNGKRKDEKQKRKAIIKEEPAPTADQFLDANLDASGLWGEGVQLLDKKLNSEAAWKFLVSMFLSFGWGSSWKRAHVVQATEPLSPDDPIAMAFSILCAFDGEVVPVELHQVLDKVDSCWTRWIPRDHKDLSETLEQVDRARFGCAMCYNLAARVISIVHSTRDEKVVKERKEAFRWMRDISNKTKRHIDTNRWLTMYFDVGWIAFECAGDKGSIDEARLCFTKLDQGLKVVRQSRHGSLPVQLELRHNSSQSYNDRIPMIEECIRTGASLAYVNDKGEVTTRHFGKQKTEN